MAEACLLAYVFQYLLLSFSDSHAYRRAARLLGLILAAPIKYVDCLCRSRRSAYDVAAGVYFFGCKRDEPISDRDMMRLYRGGGMSHLSKCHN